MIVVAAVAEEIVMGAAHAMPHATAEADTGHSGHSPHTHTE